MEPNLLRRYEQQIFSPAEYEFLELYMKLNEDRRALLRVLAQAFLDAQPEEQAA